MRVGVKPNNFAIMSNPLCWLIGLLECLEKCDLGRKSEKKYKKNKKLYKKKKLQRHGEPRAKMCSGFCLNRERGAGRPPVLSGDLLATHSILGRWELPREQWVASRSLGSFQVETRALFCSGLSSCSPFLSLSLSAQQLGQAIQLGDPHRQDPLLHCRGGQEALRGV